MKDNFVSIKFIKRGERLSPCSENMTLMYREFLQNLEEGQEVTCIFEALNDNGSAGQKAKIHIYIRKIASETGTPVSDIKTQIKQNSGLSYDNGKTFKSFAECSIHELTLVLEEIKKICEFLNIPFV